MKRFVLLLATVTGTMLLSACGSGEVAVQAQLEGETAGAGAAEPVTLENLTVALLPYDRDVIFDSLEAAYPEPEPQIPDSLVTLQERVSAAQQEWKRIESAWSGRRDSLANLKERLDAMDQESGEYHVLFRDWQDLQAEVQALGDQNDAAFEQFTETQRQLVNQSEEIKARRAQWGNEAFAAVDSVIETRLEELDREEVVDTTDATGVVRFSPEPGTWWVHARYSLPYQELYWNIPVEVKRGEPVQLQLSRENARIRPTM